MACGVGFAGCRKGEFFRSVRVEEVGGEFTMGGRFDEPLAFEGFDRAVAQEDGKKFRFGAEAAQRDDVEKVGVVHGVVPVADEVGETTDFAFAEPTGADVVAVALLAGGVVHECPRVVRGGRKRSETNVLPYHLLGAAGKI